MQAHAPVESTTRDTVAYADVLFHYACGRLDPCSLRCWIIQRVMLDEQLDHEHAEDAYERVIATERALVARQQRHRRSRHGTSLRARPPIRRFAPPRRHPLATSRVTRLA